jgi:hypothetical protein
MQVCWPALQQAASALVVQLLLDAAAVGVAADHAAPELDEVAASSA